MSVRIEVRGQKEIIARFDEIKKKIVKGELNKKRADAYREFVIIRIESNGLGLRPISAATVRIRANKTGGSLLGGSSGGSAIPMNDDGRLINAIKVKSYRDGSAQVGYFRGGGSYPDSGKTFLYIATLHHLEAGFRIPLEGNNVRSFLAAHGIIPSASKAFLNVKPRPFLYIGADLYVSSKEDELIINDYLKSI